MIKQLLRENGGPQALFNKGGCMTSSKSASSKWCSTLK